MSPAIPPQNDATNISWTIDELTAKANDALSAAKTSSSDSRMASQLTVRNLRRMVSTGAVEPAARVGREAYYGPKHLDQILAARELMSQGFTSASIQALRASIEPSAPAPATPASIFFSSSQAQASHSPLAFQGTTEARSVERGSALSANQSTHQKSQPWPGDAKLEASTAGALAFLSHINLAPPVANRHQAMASPHLPERLLLGSLNVGSAQPGLMAKSLTEALSGGEGGELAKVYQSQAYQSLGASKNNAAQRHLPEPALVALAYEADPVLGLRLSARVPPGSPPLPDEQRRAILDCAELLWDAARGAAPTDAPRA